MQYLAELYTPTQQWLSLAQDQRQAFLTGIGNGMHALAEYEINVISMGEIDLAVSHTAQQTFFALWSFDGEVARNMLINAISSTGWHDYFETVNAAGAGVDFPAHMQQLMAAV